MGAKPKAMEEIKAVIRLHQDGFSNYAIQEHTGISLPTIRKYLRSLKEADLGAGEALRLDSQRLQRFACHTNRRKNLRRGSGSFTRIFPMPKKS